MRPRLSAFMAIPVAALALATGASASPAEAVSTATVLSHADVARQLLVDRSDLPGPGWRAMSGRSVLDTKLTDCADGHPSHVVQWQHSDTYRLGDDKGTVTVDGMTAMSEALLLPSRWDVENFANAATGRFVSCVHDNIELFVSGLARVGYTVRSGDIHTVAIRNVDAGAIVDVHEVSYPVSYAGTYAFTQHYTYFTLLGERVVLKLAIAHRYNDRSGDENASRADEGYKAFIKKMSRRVAAADAQLRR